MGQKVSPHGLRVGINKEWSSEWYPSDKKDFAIWLGQDKRIRSFLNKSERDYMLDEIKIERTNKSVVVSIHTARPGVMLGEDGANVKNIELAIKKIIGRNMDLEVKVVEIDNPDLSAKLLALEIAIALENRASFRNVQKNAIRKAMSAGAKGIKTSISGRLGGVDMARAEGYSEGSVPLQTFRSDIDYVHTEALTTYGLLGIKIWIYKGQILKGGIKVVEKPLNNRPQRPQRGRKPFDRRNNDNNNRGERSEGSRRPNANSRPGGNGNSGYNGGQRSNESKGE